MAGVREKDAPAETPDATAPEAGTEAQETGTGDDGTPLEERLTRHIHPAKAWLFAAILLTLFIALLAAIVSDSGMLYAFLGFLPTIVTVLIFIWLLDGEYKDVLFWIVPLATGFLFLLLGAGANPGGQLDIPVLTAVNIALSYLILAVMVAIEYRRDDTEATLADLERFEPERLGQYIHTIEDKCKALNFVIGRVYRASNGGTKGLRERLKVPPEWYNEFNAIQPDEVREKKKLAIGLLTRIQDRLSTLLRPEKDVFVGSELKGLKGLARDSEGKDRVLDVLSVNDSDPVEDYFLGAMDFCKRIIAELEKL